ncbi:MAG TPA: citrate/2-methylcitrate synthase, partial [Micromonosporaceae bacterium]
MTSTTDVPRGLAGVVVADTEIGDVRGLEGFYHYRQFSAIELATKRSFTDVWHLLAYGDLPTSDEFATRTAALRAVPDALARVLPEIAAATAGPMDGLRAALSIAGSLLGLRPVIDLSPDQRREDTLAISAMTPTILAALYRLQNGRQPVAPRADLGVAANYLYMVTGTEPDPAHARAIEKYLIATIDHGFNASTFTARVIASTGADLVACLLGALGALSGPLHGGAPSRALDTLDAIGTPDRADAWIRARVLAGERIMGFGHPIYRTE